MCGLCGINVYTCSPIYLYVCIHLYTYAYITTRSLTMVLLYPYRIVKSVSVGTDLRIILKKPLIDNQSLYISV